jgi:hypothetical protein
MIRQDKCPVEVAYDQKWYIHESYYRENKLKKFAKKFPDIDGYFEHLKQEIIKDNEREKEIEKRLENTIYL